MRRPPKVKIKHGDIVAEVAASTVPAYERNGWTVVDDGSSEPEAPVAPPEEPEEPKHAKKTAKKTTSREAE